MDPGDTLAHYEIDERIGAGGMGEVYKAHDSKLNRTVALKLLHPEAVGNPDRTRRFVQEAQSASAIDHANIVTIYDIFQIDGQHCIAMQYVDGRSLAELLAERRLSIDEALGYAVQIASALAAAHGAGIVHRDIKPANIMVTESGHIKVLDFGLAKLVERGEVDDSAPTLSERLKTERGVVLGTPAYMSPEQAEGKPVDPRSDVFSFGTVLFELLSGQRPFHGDSHVSMRMAILRDEPPSLKRVGVDVPAELERILRRCLEKSVEARFESAEQVLEALAAYLARQEAAKVGLRALLRKPSVVLPASVLLVGLLVGATWFLVRASRVRWARDEAIPEIVRLSEEENNDAAFRLALEAEQTLPDDPELKRLMEQISRTMSIGTDPPGADVFVKHYMATEGEWLHVGRSPIKEARIPESYLRWRIIKEGYEPFEGAFHALSTHGKHHFILTPEGENPPGMVRVPGGSMNGAKFEAYWIDRFEVKNREFQEFVQAGGYEKPEYWKHPFIKDGEELSWEQAMKELKDVTGRPGPATWELGTYPEGKADYPVSGVSWYEAAAYAEFAGKELPTVSQWQWAAFDPSTPGPVRSEVFEGILLLSNFDSSGPAPVGAYAGLGPYGTYDMAGNVREWCLNRVGTDARAHLGTAWNDPMYIFPNWQAAQPFDRTETNGFRGVKYDAPLPMEHTRPLTRRIRDYSKEAPVDDTTFAAYRRLYAYDRTELNAKIESVTENDPRWRDEKITFDAAYGGGRMIAHLLLPRNAAPPFQVVVFFPGDQAFDLKWEDSMRHLKPDFLIQTGRALLYPFYNAMHERTAPVARGPNAYRDRVIEWSKDLGRSIDYLETRDDIDSDRVAYFGISSGASLGPILTAIEKRLKASVLMGGGFGSNRPPPEIDRINFAPRVKVPTLMLNGRYDSLYTLENHQLPMFRWLGAPQENKRHALFDSGHEPPRAAVIRETLDWLDRYLGPVTLTAPRDR